MILNPNCSELVAQIKVAGKMIDVGNSFDDSILSDDEIDMWGTEVLDLFNHFKGNMIIDESGGHAGFLTAWLKKRGMGLKGAKKFYESIRTNNRVSDEDEKVNEEMVKGLDQKPEIDFYTNEIEQRLTTKAAPKYGYGKKKAGVAVGGKTPYIRQQTVGRIQKPPKIL